jgi:hypothetical protein
VSETYDRYERLRERRLMLDDCPDCEGRMTHVLTVNGGPDAAGGGGFLACARCQTLYVRADGGRWRVTNPFAMALAREVLRLRAQLATRPVPESSTPG